MRVRAIAFICLSVIGSSFIALPVHAAQVSMEEMTWMEIHDRMEGGARVAIVPIGGTEQNGPHMVMGKHNAIVRHTAGEIAKKLGTGLVAPVIAYVPEGRIDPPEGHMQFPGTISIAGDTFAAVLEDTARSLKQHGFKWICFIGDHGGTQEIQRQMADRLTRQWAGDGVRVLHVSDYYSNNGQERWAESAGINASNIGAHGGFADTSELMAVDPRAVRDHLRAARRERDYKTTGAMGDSSQASANYGRRLLTLKVDAAVAQIQSAITAAQ